jgi:hypothetical protein
MLFLPSFSWVLVALMPVSWIMSIVAAVSCSFLSVLIENPLNPKEDLEWGLGFSKMYLPLELASTFGQNGGCEALDTDTGNTSMLLSNSAAKSFASFNCILTTVGFSLSIALTLKLTMIERRDFAWLIMRISMYISMFCCIFTFYLQESEICNVQPCSLGNHGILQVVNVIFLLIICIILFLVEPGNTPYIRHCYVSAQAVYDRNVERGRKDPEFPARA